LHLVGILFPHINDDAWSESLKIYPISFTLLAVQTEDFPVRAAAHVSYSPGNGRRRPIWTGSSLFHYIPAPSWCNVHLDSQILYQVHILQSFGYFTVYLV